MHSPRVPQTGCERAFAEAIDFLQEGAVGAAAESGIFFVENAEREQLGASNSAMNRDSRARTSRLAKLRAMRITSRLRSFKLCAFSC